MRSMIRLALFLAPTAALAQAPSRLAMIGEWEHQEQRVFGYGSRTCD